MDKNNNSMVDIPAAACKMCGGWTGFGGVSQHSQSVVPVHGRTGCFCHGTGTVLIGGKRVAVSSLR